MWDETLELSQDLYRGALYGTAYGDAFGEQAMQGALRHELVSGLYTDDTSMALCIADSLLRCDYVEPVDIMSRYLLWYRRGRLSATGKCHEIGATTRACIDRFEATGNPMSGKGNELAAGNGSIVRLAPVAMFYAGNLSELYPAAARTSETTHGSDDAVSACQFLAGIVAGLLRGDRKDRVLSPHYKPDSKWREGTLSYNVMRVASGSYKNRDAGFIKGGSSAVETLEAALWSFHRTKNLADCVDTGASIGAHADSVGAVCGMLAGACYGASSFPKGWDRRIARFDLLQKYADSLHRRAFLHKPKTEAPLPVPGPGEPVSSIVQMRDEADMEFFRYIGIAPGDETDSFSARKRWLAYVMSLKDTDLARISRVLYEGIGLIQFPGSKPDRELSERTAADRVMHRKGEVIAYLLAEDNLTAYLKKGEEAQEG